MITFDDVEYLLLGSIPELKEWNYPKKQTLKIFSLLNNATELTIQALKKHDLLSVRKYLVKMENLFKNADHFTKNIVRKIYFEGIKYPLAVCSEEEQLKLKNVIPISIIHIR